MNQSTTQHRSVKSSRPPWNSRFWTGSSQSARSKSLDYHQSRRARIKPSSVRIATYCGTKSQPDLFYQPGDRGRPSSFLDHSHQQFLLSLRNFQSPTNANKQPYSRVTDLGRYFRLSRDILDRFCRLKSGQFDSAMMMEMQSPIKNGHQIDTGQQDQMDQFDLQSALSSTPRKQTSTARSKSANSTPSGPCRNAQLGGSSLDKNREDQQGGHQHEDKSGQDGQSGMGGQDRDEQWLFHQSLDKISSIANWEKQLRYEMEIEKELQRRQIERQQEKLSSDRRKLEEWDKQLRIELDGRERKLRLSEQEFRSRCEEYALKSSELTRRESMLNEIVEERLKVEMKAEIDKLRKKFNELELEKSNLARKEGRVKEVEARLHEQVKIVKEKIDNKRLTDIEMVKHRKELDIVRKENEVLKQRVDSMEDYQLNKFENRSMKNELQIVRETLEAKCQELERERDRWEKEQRSTDQKIVSLRAELRRAEQELVIHKQKASGDLEEMTSKYEAVNGQVKRLQTFIKEHLAKLRYDPLSPAPQHLQHPAGSPIHRRHHSTHQLQKQVATGRHVLPNGTYHHQRSVSMDGANQTAQMGYPRQYPTGGGRPRGCHLCDEDESSPIELIHQVYEHCGEQLDEDLNNNQSTRLDYSILGQQQTADQSLWPDGGDCPNQQKQQSGRSISHQIGLNDTRDDDQVVQKIVNKIYEKMNSAMATASEDQGRPFHQGQNQLSSLLEEDCSNQEDAPQLLPPSNTDYSKVQQSPRSLYEELLTETARGHKASPVVSPDGVDRTRWQSSVGSHEANGVLPSELLNDDNNNSIDKHLAQQQQKGTSGGGSRTNSGTSSGKSSESFEVDW